jgi:CRISPR-associated protein Cas1
MTYVFDKPGTYVGKKSATLSVKLPDKTKREIAVKKIGSVMITSRVQVSYDALKILAQHGIPVVFVSQNRPIAVFHPFALHGTVLTRRAQFLAYLDERGAYLARRFIEAAMENRIRFLRRIQRTRKDTQPEVVEKIEKVIEGITRQKEKIEVFNGTIEDIRWQLMGLEGTAARDYFEAYRLIFSKDLRFKGRVKRPPRDPVNSALSFGYTILYGEVLKGIAVAGLEPFAGFLHADRSGKPSLALDLIEEFRQFIVDRLVAKLFVRKMLKAEDFTWEESRCLFSQQAKELFIKQYHAMLEEVVNVKDKRYSLQQAIIKQARNLTRFLVGKNPTYEPFLIPR